ncbi:hypothetical protein [Streptomyces sp. NPDC007088]|uniref:hypothetical protein n=1 Tax=Streptomyces sp. NPDC007088 TaxID=3364773 RepID=UPI0036C4B961
MGEAAGAELPGAKDPGPDPDPDAGADAGAGRSAGEEDTATVRCASPAEGEPPAPQAVRTSPIRREPADIVKRL